MAEKQMTNGNTALQEKQSRVITIGADEKPKNIRLRVAAYIRVSSASEDQLNSFAAQNRYYTNLISGKENWSLVDIYADEGITGTSQKSGRFSAAPGGLPQRFDRSGTGKVHLQICKEYQGMSGGHPGIEESGYRCLL